MPRNVADIIEELKGRQKAEALSDEAFGEKLGMSRQSWNFIKLGQREPTNEQWPGIIRAYPDLGAQVIMAYGEKLLTAAKGEAKS